jgi:hypothetical protein
MTNWQTALLATTATWGLATGALAQTPLPSGPAAATQQPIYDPQQLPAYKGQVQQFTLTPRGDIDGLILVDGTEVKLPPHLSTELAFSVKPGDTVTIHGLKAASLALIQASSITDDASGKTVVDNGRQGPGPRPGPDPDQAGIAEASGKVRMALHDPRGDVNGVLLTDGTVLRLPPPEAVRFASLLQPGQPLVVEGRAYGNALGKVVEVSEIGATYDHMNEIAGPGPGPKGPRPPRP